MVTSKDLTILTFKNFLGSSQKNQPAGQKLENDVESFENFETWENDDDGENVDNDVWK